MGTFAGEYGKAIVDRIIADNDGWGEDKEVAPDNPRCVKIVEYTDYSNARVWGLAFENETEPARNRYDYPSEYVRDPKVLWELASAKPGATE